MRRAKPLLTPADVREPEVVPPVVGLERHRASASRNRVDAIAGPLQHEPERRPRFTRLRIEPARLARMVGRLGQRVRVGRRIGARHLELHHAGVRQPDVRRRVLGHRAQRALEDLARARDLFALEALERRPALDERAMRREQRLEPGVGLARGAARHGDAETVAAPRNRFDVPRAEKPPEARDRLLEAVVANRDVLPAGLEQIVLGDDLPGPRHEQQQHIQLPIGNRDRFSRGAQAASNGIELERFEDESRACPHGRIVTSSAAATDGHRLWATTHFLAGFSPRRVS